MNICIYKCDVFVPLCTCISFYCEQCFFAWLFLNKTSAHSNENVSLEDKERGKDFCFLNPEKCKNVLIYMCTSMRHASHLLSEAYIMWSKLSSYVKECIVSQGESVVYGDHNQYSQPTFVCNCTDDACCFFDWSIFNHFCCCCCCSLTTSYHEKVTHELQCECYQLFSFYINLWIVFL